MMAVYSNKCIQANIWNKTKCQCINIQIKSIYTKIITGEILINNKKYHRYSVTACYCTQDVGNTENCSLTHCISFPLSLIVFEFIRLLNAWYKISCACCFSSQIYFHMDHTCLPLACRRQAWRQTSLLLDTSRCSRIYPLCRRCTDHICQTHPGRTRLLNWYSPASSRHVPVRFCPMRRIRWFPDGRAGFVRFRPVCTFSQRSCALCSSRQNKDSTF